MDNYDYVALTNEVVRRGANLFGTFEEWTKGAFALSALGENGRVLFKNISKLSDKYNEVENDKKIHECFAYKQSGKYSVIYLHVSTERHRYQQVLLKRW